MAELFSGSFISEFKRRYPGAWMEMLMAFEKKLENIGEADLAPILISIPVVFAETLRRQLGMRVQAAINKSSRHGHVTWCDQGEFRESMSKYG